MLSLIATPSSPCSSAIVDARSHDKDAVGGRGGQATRGGRGTPSEGQRGLGGSSRGCTRCAAMSSSLAAPLPPLPTLPADLHRHTCQPCRCRRQRHPHGRQGKPGGRGMLLAVGGRPSGGSRTQCRSATQVCAPASAAIAHAQQTRLPCHLPLRRTPAVPGPLPA